MKQPLNREKHETALREKMESYRPGSYASVVEWVSLIAGRRSPDISFWNIDRHILDVFSKKGR